MGLGTIVVADRRAVSGTMVEKDCHEKCCLKLAKGDYQKTCMKTQSQRNIQFFLEYTVFNRIYYDFYKHEILLLYGKKITTSVSVYLIANG